MRKHPRVAPRRAFGWSLLYELAPEKIPYTGGDLFVVGIQREVARIQEVDFRIRSVSLVRFRAGRQEERVVLAPHGQHGRTMLAEAGLEVRIERNICGPPPSLPPRLIWPRT